MKLICHLLNSFLFKAILFFAYFFICNVNTVSAQLIAKGRYEREVKSSDNAFTLIGLGDNGIVLIQEKNKYKDGKRLWEVIQIDTTMTEKWQSDIEIKSNYNLVGYEYNRNNVYFLFREGEKEFNKFSLVQVNIHNHLIRYFEINHELSFRLTHFTLVGENAILGGYVTREPTVMLFETSTQSIKVIPGFFLKDTELLDVRMNNNSTFNALTIERNELDKRHLVLRTFDETGALLLEDAIEIEKEKNILTGISSSLKREELIVLGTYTEGVNNSAIGYYSLMIDPFSEQPINYIPFTKLDYFLGYLPSKKAAKIRARAKRRMDMGKGPDYKAYILPVRIQESNDGFYFLSEMYDPSSTNTRSNYNNYNNPYGYGYSPYSYSPFMNRYSTTPYSFNNYNQSSSAKITESILTLFDNKGRLVWDNSLKFDNVKRNSLEQNSDFVLKNDFMLSIYKKERELFVSYGSLNANPEIDTVSIPINNNSEVVRYESEDDSGIRYWYDDKVYVWGYQALKDRTKREIDQSRHVFYINKFEAE